MIDLKFENTNNKIFDRINELFKSEDITMEEKISIISNNFECILILLDVDDVYDFFEFLNKIPELRKLLVDNYHIILKKLGAGNPYNLGLDYFEDRIVLNYFIYLQYNKVPIKKIIEIAIEFCNYNANFVKNLLLVKNYLNLERDDLKLLSSELNKFYLHNQDLVIKNLVVDDFIKTFAKYKHENFFKDFDQTYELFFINIIKELMQLNKVDYSEIEKFSRGSYSNVYKFGDKILKIGIPRHNYLIPNSKYIIQPLIRLELNGLFEPFMCVEIMEEVYIENITLRDVGKLRNKLESEGLKAVDLNVLNVGRLKKSNYAYYTEDDYFIPNAESLGFKGKNNTTLAAGNIVVIDTDYIKRVKSKKIRKLRK